MGFFSEFHAYRREDRAWGAEKKDLLQIQCSGVAEGLNGEAGVCSWMLLWEDAPVAVPLRPGLPDQHRARTGARG